MNNTVTLELPQTPPDKPYAFDDQAGEEAVEQDLI
jgi:hypothetical protein